MANFPGGMRLGATNPNRFNLEFFVNDLGKPGAPTFESLGTLPYSQHHQIHLRTGKSVPTDGLVLRGMYNTITLAVYGTLCKLTAEQLASQAAAAAAAAASQNADNTAVTEDASDDARRLRGNSNERTAEYVELPTARPDSGMSGGPDGRGTPSSLSAHHPSEEERPDRRRNQHYQQHHHSYHHHQPPPHHLANGGRGDSGEDDLMIGGGGRRSRSHDRSRSPMSDVGRRGGGASPPLLPNNSSSSSARPESRTPSERHSSASRHSSVPRDGSVSREAAAASGQEQQHSSQSAPVAPAPVQDDLFEEMSDISDGDIPDLSDKEEEVAEDPSKREEEAPAITATGGSAEGGGGPAAAASATAAVAMHPEEKSVDMEEISDEEAEWSDDGMDLDMASVDFGDDWEEPVKIFDFETVDVQEAEPRRLPDAAFEAVLGHLGAAPTGSTAAWIGHVEQLAEMLEGETASATQAAALRERVLSMVNEALDLGSALAQEVATDKVRHIKTGLRLARSLLSSSRALSEVLLKEGDLQRKLLDFVVDKSLSYSIKLLALQSLDESIRTMVYLLQTTDGGESEIWTNKAKELYSQLSSIYESAGTRVKQPIKVILNKMNFFDVVSQFRTAVRDAAFGEEGELDSKKVTELCKQGEQIVAATKETRRLLSQPKKMHPVRFTYRAVGEELLDDPFPFLLDTFSSCKLLECLYALLSKASSSLRLFHCACRVLEALTEIPGSAAYFCESARTTNSLIRFLIALSDSSVTNLVTNLSVTVHASQAARRIERFTEGSAAEDEGAALESLQTVFGMTFSPEGKVAVCKAMGRERFLPLLLKLCLLDSDDEVAGGEINFTREAIRNYALELLLILVKTLEEPDVLLKDLDGLVGLVDKLKEGENLKAGDLDLWVKPLGMANNLSALSEVVKKNVDSVFPVSVDLVVAARLVERLTRPCEAVESQHHQETVLISVQSQGLAEHFHAILNKVSEAHEYPHLHQATFSGEEGLLLFSALAPIVRAVRALLRFSVASRGGDFRDVSWVAPLARVHALARAVPRQAESAAGTLALSGQVAEDVAEILANYTVPAVSKESAASAGKADKNCWTLMLGEVLDTAIAGPLESSVAHLELLNGLLPLPLPMATTGEEDENDAPVQAESSARAENARKLWSVHLVSIHKKIRTLISRLLCVRDYRVSEQLVHLCRRISDLSSPTAVMVAEECVEAVEEECRRRLILSDGGVEGADVPSSTDNGPLPPRSIQVLHHLASVPRFASALMGVLDKEEGKAQRFMSLLKGELEAHKKCSDTALAVLGVFEAFCGQTMPKPNEERENFNFSVEAFKFALEQLVPLRKSSVSVMWTWKFLAPAVATEEGCRSFLEAAKAFPPRVIYSLCESLLQHTSDESFFQRHCSHLLNVMERVGNCFSDAPLEAEAAEEEATMTFSQVMGAAPDGGPTSTHPLMLIKERLEKNGAKEELVVRTERQVSLLRERAAWKLSDWRKPSDGADKEKRTFFSSDTEKAVYRMLHPHTIPSRFKREDVSVDLLAISESCIKGDFQLISAVQEACSESRLLNGNGVSKSGAGGGKGPGSPRKKSILEKKALQNKNIISSFRAGGSVFSLRGMRVFGRLGGGPRPDGFRSRPPNTSRPPSLHVDDFLLLQSRGQQPTGPTGYNKQSVKAAKELFAQREAHHAGPAPGGGPSIVGFREATKEPVFDDGIGSLGRPPGLGGLGGRRGGPGGGRLDKGGPPPMGFRGGGGGRGRGGGGDRGWSPIHVGDLERRKWLPPPGVGMMGPGGGGMPDIPRGMGKDRRRGGGPGGPGGGRDDGRMRHMRNMNR